MSESLIFYTNPMSRGQIVRWMLEEVGQPYETKIIDYGEPLKSPDYLAINPMGKLPSLVHEGRVVTECAAICAYLALAFPNANLAASEGQEANYLRWLFFAAGPLEAAITNRSLGWEPSDEQQRMAGYGNYDLVVNTLSDFLRDRQYVCDDKFTAADVYLGSHIDFGLQFGSLDKTPEFEAYVSPFRARSAYQQAKKIDMALMPETN